MAQVTQVTISTANTVKIDNQEREVGIALTYRLDPEDIDVMQVVCEKAAEVARAHLTAWKSLRDEAVASRNGKHEDNDPAQEVQVPAHEEEETQAEFATETQLKAIDALVRASLLSENEFEALLQERFGCSRTEELSRRQAGSLLVELQRNERERLARFRGENGGATNGRATPTRRK